MDAEDNEVVEGGPMGPVNGGNSSLKEGSGGEGRNVTPGHLLVGMTETLRSFCEEC